MKIVPYKKILTGIFLFFICIFFNCCEQQLKFDSIKWNKKDDPAFPSPYRKQMLKDLLSNQKLVGLNYSELIRMLGKPSYKEGNSICYQIEIDYGSDIDPVYTKNLCLYFSEDSTVTSFKVDEWNK